MIFSISIFESYGIDTMPYETKLGSWFKIYLEPIVNYKDIFILLLRFIYYVYLFYRDLNLTQYLEITIIVQLTKGPAIFC